MQLKEKGIPTGVSNRHLHVSKEDLAILFGEGYELTQMKDLKQPGQYAAEELVTIKGPKGSIEKVRILGPVRNATQVEISKSDAFKMGVNPPVRDSGDLEGSSAVTIIGPNGEVAIEKGLILAKRHIHMHTSDAEYYKVKDKDIISVLAKTDGRTMIYQDVLVRVSEKFALEFHVDTDEANASLLKNNDEIFIVEIF
jgi:putative phosphotransacetylase